MCADGQWRWLVHGGVKEGAEGFSATLVMNVLTLDIKEYMSNLNSRV